MAILDPLSAALENERKRLTPAMTPYKRMYGMEDPMLSGRSDASTVSDIFRPRRPGRGDLMAADATDMAKALQNEDYRRRAPGELARFDRAQGGTLVASDGREMSVAAALAAGAALRKQREMMQPNVAAQAQGGVSGRPMPQTGISQAEFGNPMSRFRQVMEPGLTREERQRRMRNFDGMDERAAGRAAGVQEARIRADGQVGAAREEAQGSIAAALAGRGGGADANGDGVVSTKERIAFAEKWAKLDQGRMIESLDPGKAPTQRPLTRGEQVLESELSRILLQGGQGGAAPAADTMEQPPEMQQPDAPARNRGFPGGQVLNKLVPGLELLDPQSGIRRAMRGDLGGAAPSAAAQPLQPGAAYVERLRQMRDNPQAVAAFERRFGAGSAAQYLQ